MSNIGILISHQVSTTKVVSVGFISTVKQAEIEEDEMGVARGMLAVH